MSKTEKFTFNTKLYKVCSTDKLRPALQCILFKNRFAYATNGIIVIKQPLEFHGIINDEFLEGKLLHADSYQAIMNFEICECDELGVKCKNINGEEAFFYYYDLKEEKYPDIEKLINERIDLDAKPIEQIGINYKQLSLLCDAFEGFDRYVRLRFSTSTKAILVDIKLFPEQIGIIMPTTLDDNLFENTED